jgi:hypothetical protein
MKKKVYNNVYVYKKSPVCYMTTETEKGWTHFQEQLDFFPTKKALKEYLKSHYYVDIEDLIQKHFKKVRITIEEL